MAEIKNTFTQGKMNKDLDERLLPVGQYRDAMNIEISTSDGSDVGTVQNILGNKRISNIQEGVCVGTIADEKNNQIYWFVRYTEGTRFIDSPHSKIFRLNQDDNTVDIVLTDFLDILKFRNNNIITGINIIDGLLFFTDNITEPKKINIQRCIEGTDQTGTVHTQLIVNNISQGDLLEEHITVIKKSPKYPPALEMTDGVPEGVISGTSYIDFANLTPQDTANIVVIVPDAQSVLDSNVFSIGTIVVFDSYETSLPPVPLSDYVVKASVTSIDAIASNELEISVSIISISNQTPIGRDIITNNPPTFVMSIFQQEERLFENKFPRFAYRYKYEDNEYSSFSPFSEIAFLPGNLDYHPKKGFNLGMKNKLTELYITEFVTQDIPLDVVAIDILYKESTSNNIYVLDTIRPNDAGTVYTRLNPWNEENFADNGQNKKRNGKYKVKSETIYLLLEQNQLLRPYDNVPRLALSQEIVANRLVYGNYLQNYNLTIDDESNFKPDLQVSLRSFSNQTNYGRPYKSLKSLREYEVGVVYTDQYGRQTPVLTNETASITVPKVDADNSLQLAVRLNNLPPSFATGFKFYVKQTSGEYYNLAMDRFYDAGDGNIWLAFPSADRNKVDEDTFLILKKGVEKNNLVTAQAKYKILAIANQAPDFIKKIKLPIGTLLHNSDVSSLNIFGTNSTLFPLQSRTSFSINYDPLKNSSLSNIYELVEQNKKIFVSFKNTTNQTSRKYRVSSIAYDKDTSVSINVPATGSQLIISLKDELESDVNFIHNSTTDIIIAGTSIIFEEESFENASKFDGRFFVKIFNDGVTQVELPKITDQNTKYRVMSERAFYYLHPDVVLLLSSNINARGYIAPFSASASNGGIVQAIQVDGDHASGLRPDLEMDFLAQGQVARHLNTFGAGSATVTGSSNYGDLMGYFAYDFWYKYTAWFRGKGSYGISDRSSTASDTTFEDVWYIDGNTSAGTHSSADHISFAGNNIEHIGMGIQNYNNSCVIEIGFGGLEPDPDQIDASKPLYNDTSTITNRLYPGNETDDGYYLAGDSTIYNVGEENINSNYGNEQVEFSSKLEPGTKIRWKEDPRQNVYTIVNVSNWYLLRYSPDGGNVGTSVLHKKTATHNRPENFNRNWRLTLDKPIDDWNPITGDGLKAGQFPMNGFSPNTDQYIAVDSTIETATGYTLEIVEPIFDDEVLPDNPAIWETEPKEQVDLDIYYEASQEYPIVLNEKNIANVIKIGSKITDNQNTEHGTIINILFEESKHIIAVNNFSVHALSDGDEIFFTKDDVTIRSVLVESTSVINNQPVPGYITIDPAIHDKTIELNWFNCYSFGNGVESNRIEDNFNKPFIDNGPKASTTLNTEDSYKEERRKYGLIFSGVYNSTSGINNLNQFIQAENITKEVNPTYGSIQKLFTRRTDLVTFCEDKVLRILADKTALFTADGESNVTATSDILGQTIPFVGDYGISQNPESFAQESYRAYFTDKQRGAVLRLSMDGLTPISDAGMSDWFGDNLKNKNYLIGTYDQDKGEYNITLKEKTFISSLGEDYTVSFDEDVRGWVSFKSFIVENGVSSANKYYTFKDGDIYEHHTGEDSRNVFYNKFTPSSVTLIFNQEPSIIKEFRALNYEGSQGKIISNTKTIASSYKNLNPQQGWYTEYISTNLQTGLIPYFIEKENKWFNYIKGEKTTFDNLDSSEFSFQGLGIVSSVELPPPPPPVAPGNLLLTNIVANSNLSYSQIQVSFASATGSDGQFSYSSLRYREVGSSIYTIIQNTPSPNTNYLFNYNWTALNLSSDIEVEYTVSNNGNLYTSTQTISIIRYSTINPGNAAVIGCGNISANNYNSSADLTDPSLCTYNPLVASPITATVSNNIFNSVDIDINFSTATGGVPTINYSDVEILIDNIVVATVTVLPGTNYTYQYVWQNDPSTGFALSNPQQVDFEARYTVTDSSGASSTETTSVITLDRQGIIAGCGTVGANNYNASVNFDNGTCTYAPITAPSITLFQGFIENFGSVDIGGGVFVNVNIWRLSMSVSGSTANSAIQGPISYEVEYGYTASNTPLSASDFNSTNINNTITNFQSSPHLVPTTSTLPVQTIVNMGQIFNNNSSMTSVVSIGFETAFDVGNQDVTIVSSTSPPIFSPFFDVVPVAGPSSVATSSNFQYYTFRIKAIPAIGNPNTSAYKTIELVSPDVTTTQYTFANVFTT